MTQMSAQLLYLSQFRILLSIPVHTYFCWSVLVCYCCLCGESSIHNKSVTEPVKGIPQLLIYSCSLVRNLGLTVFAPFNDIYLLILKKKEDFLS